MLTLLQSVYRCKAQGLAVNTRIVSRAATFPVMNRMKDKVVIKHEEGKPRFTFSFVFAPTDTKPGRQFNMSRDLSETSEQFVQRIQANVGKIADKKNKKKKKKIHNASGGESDAGQQAEHTESSIKVNFFTEEGNCDLVEIGTARDLIYHPGVKMKINSTEYRLSVNPPLVDSVRIAGPVMTNCFVYPLKLKTLFADEARTRFIWSIEKSPNTEEVEPKKPRIEEENPLDYETRCEGFFFYPEPADIGCRVRLDVTAVSGEEIGDVTTVYSEGLVEAGPDVTPTTKRQARTNGCLQYPFFRVVSYNILADLYADSDFSRESLFPQCPPFALEYQYRGKLILNELINFHPDIICLQETDRKVFQHDLLPVLNKLGFMGEFKLKGGMVDEGLSVFYRSDQFGLLESRGSVLSEVLEEPRFAHVWNVIKKRSALVEKMKGLTAAVFIAVLQCKHDPNKLLVVGNTHLYYKPDADHIRLLQTEMCLVELKETRREILSRYPDTEVGILFCGDFNSTPPFGVLKYVTEGSLSSKHPDWSIVKEEMIESLSLSHPFNLNTATGTPKYTNYTIGFKDCLDYIFYDENSFSVEQVVPFPTDDELGFHQALPNVSFPSDHVSLVAELKWIK